MIHPRHVYSIIKITKYSVQTKLFTSQGNQLHVSAKICSHHPADYENKKEKKFTAAWA